MSEKEKIPPEAGTLHFSKCKNEAQLKKVYDYNADVFAEAGDFVWSLANLKKEQKQGWDIYSVSLNGEIIAAAFVKLDNGALHTKNTALKMSYQGRGISHKIKEFYEQIAGELKASSIVNYCAVDNFRTIALNESHGYHKVAVSHNGEITHWEKKL